MKKIFLIISITVLSVGGANADQNNKVLPIPDIFKVVLTASGNAEWINKESYIKRIFRFNGKEISGYYIGEDRLKGISYKLSPEDLPDEILNCIKKSYSDFKIKDAIVFIDAEGNINYYAGVRNSKKYLALKISSTLRINVMKKITVKQKLHS